MNLQSLHPAHDTLERFAFKRLPGSEAVGIEAHLLECEDCQLKLIAIVPPLAPWSGPERRKEPRVVVDVSAKVKILNPVTSTGPAAPARIVNLSWNGMELRMRRLLCAGDLLQIRFEQKIVLAEVRYCNRVGDEYGVGVRLVEILYERRDTVSPPASSH